jgi:hypothetical protein
MIIIRGILAILFSVRALGIYDLPIDGDYLIILDMGLLFWFVFWVVKIELRNEDSK